MANLTGKKIRFNQSTEYNTALTTYSAGHVYFTNNNNDTNNNAIILEGKIYGAAPMVELQYSQLTALVANKKLIPGTNYKITNYVTATSQEGTKSAGIPFDIIVTAISNDTLSEDAKADYHGTYFSQENISAWELKYCLSNDTARFGWASSTGTGVVYYMKDEFNNEAWYDFKNIQFLRNGSWIRDNCYRISALPDSASLWVDTYFYTFSAISSNGTAPNDDSLNKGAGIYHATDNHLGKDVRIPMMLNNTIFIDTPNNGAFNNRIASGHRDNTFGANTWNNIIEYNFKNNHICDTFQSNTIGVSFKNNQIYKSFVRNIVKDDFQNNSIYFSTSKTTFGTAFSYNQFLSSSASISNCTFGSNINHIYADSTNASIELNNISFASECFSSDNGTIDIFSITDIYGNLIKDKLLEAGEKFLVRNEESNGYIVFNHWVEKKNIERLLDNIYDLGEVASSGTAETTAKNPNVCTNKDILFIKYKVGNNTGLITQHVTNGSTYQYIEWAGFLKYRKITWTNIGGTISVTNNPSWINILDKSNGKFYLNGTELNLSNYVTTNSAQTISGEKTFTSNIKINEKDIIISGDTKISGSIDAGEFKVFDNRTSNKGFTIRTESSKINDLYPVQLLATNNSKSVQYKFPLQGPQSHTDSALINYPVNKPINVITEYSYATPSRKGIAYICDAFGEYLTPPNPAYINSNTALSTLSAKRIVDNLITYQERVSILENDFSVMSTTTAEALVDLDNRIKNISFETIQEEIDTNAEVVAAAITDLNERLTNLETLVNKIADALTIK